MINDYTLTLVLVPFILYHHYLFYIGCKTPEKTTSNNISNRLIVSRIFLNILLVMWLWIVVMKQNFDKINPFLQGAWGMYLGVPLIILGQLLNFSLYYTIGYEGVNYGLENGKIKYTPGAGDNYKIDGFPFSYGNVPQYTGVILFTIGCFLVWGISTSKDTTTNGAYTFNKPMLFICGFSIITYYFSIIMEKNCIIKSPNPTHQK